MSLQPEVKVRVQPVLELHIDVVLLHRSLEGSQVFDGSIKFNILISTGEVAIDADWILYTGQGQLDVFNRVFSLSTTDFLDHLTRDWHVVLVLLSWHLVLSDGFVDLAVAASLDVEAKFAIDLVFVVFALDDDGHLCGLAVEGGLA